jgi:hypothetical protein
VKKLAWRIIDLQQKILEPVSRRPPGHLATQTSELDSLRSSYSKSQADLIAARESRNNAPAVSATTATHPSQLSQLSLTLNYATRRLADANLIANKLGPQFKDLQLVVCPMDCTRTAQINYGYDLSAPIAFFWPSCLPNRA